MENLQEKRLMALKDMSKDELLFKASQLLTQSIEDPLVSNAEHKKLFSAFMKKLDTDFSSPNEAEKMLIKHVCWTKHSKKEIENTTKETLSEHLQGQIDQADIWDAGGKISPETLWGVICFRFPLLKEKYSLVDVYKGDEDIDLKSSIVSVVVALAMHSNKTRHLRR